MREILFRGKRIDKSEWVEGSLVQMLVDGRIASCIAPIEEVSRANKDVPPMGIQYTLNKDIFLVHPDTLGQYTGLTDKSGNKIFEGDIIAVDKIKGNIKKRVRYDVDFGMWKADRTEGSTQDFELYVFADLGCVIGNIHDNPELTKGGMK